MATLNQKTSSYEAAFESKVREHAIEIKAEALADSDALSAVKSAVRGKYSVGKDRVSRARAVLLTLDASETLAGTIESESKPGQPE